MSDEREALARLVNDEHSVTRDWDEMMRKKLLDRSNGDDYAISQAYRTADALIAAGFGDVAVWRERATKAEAAIQEALKVIPDQYKDGTEFMYELGDDGAALQLVAAALSAPVAPARTPENGDT